MLKDEQRLGRHDDYTIVNSALLIFNVNGQWTTDNAESRNYPLPLRPNFRETF